jgi:hypothetical protein
VPTTFGTLPGPNASLNLFDGNFTPLAAAINDLATYGNYYVDSGAANAIAITTAAPLTVAYTTGLWADVFVGFNNTSTTVTLNWNGLGAKTVLGTNGSVPPIGSILGGYVYRFVYDGTVFRIMSGTTSDKGFFVATLTVGCVTQPTFNVGYSRNGDAMTMTMPQAGFGGTSNATNFIVSGVPSLFQPVLTQYCYLSVQDNGTNIFGGIQIGSAGSGGFWNFFTTAAVNLNGFTAAGSKGMTFPFTFTYKLTS